VSRWEGGREGEREGMILSFLLRSRSERGGTRVRVAIVKATAPNEYENLLPNHEYTHYRRA